MVHTHSDLIFDKKFLNPKTYVRKVGQLLAKLAFQFNLPVLVTTKVDDLVISRLTDTPFNESYPFYSNSKKMLTFISDKNGINNIFMRADHTESIIAITNILTGITQLSWNINTDQLLFTGFNSGGYDIFTIHNPSSYYGIELTDANWKSKEKTNLSLLVVDKNKEKADLVVEKNKYKNYIFLDSEKKVQLPELKSENIHLNSRNKIMNIST